MIFMFNLHTINQMFLNAIAEFKNAQYDYFKGSDVNWQRKQVIIKVIPRKQNQIVKQKKLLA